MTLYAVLIACFSLISQIDWAPDLGDEGFLWYGAQQTFRGHVPILDFQAYFPGRYYFSAAVFHFLGPDLLALRIAGWLFQILAIILAFWIAKRITQSKVALFLLGTMIVLWMTVPFRYFDSALVIAAVFFAVRLLEKPTVWRHLCGGIFVGVCLFFGINHGWYSFVIFQLLILLNALLTNWRKYLRNEFLFLVGLAIGCLPLITMFIFIPGFESAFMDNLMVLLSRNNDPALPIPWPWTIRWTEICQKFPLESQRLLEFSHELALGSAFLALPVFYIGTLTATLFRAKTHWKEDALWTACAMVGVVYLHHMFRRGNIVYLGETITPFLIGALGIACVCWSQRKQILAMLITMLLILMTFFGPGLLNNYWYRAFLPAEALTQVQIGKHLFWTETKNAIEIESVDEFVKGHVANDESIFLAPMLAMHYCLLDKISPAYQIYFIFPEPEKSQKKMIESFEQQHLRWAIVGDPVIDGFPDLHFSNTHALIWHYLRENFDPYVVPGFPKGHYAWKRKGL